MPVTKPMLLMIQVVTSMPTLIQMPVVTSMPRGQYAFGVSTPHDPGRRSAFGAPDIWLLISCCGCFWRGSSARWFPGVGPLVSLRPWAGPGSGRWDRAVRPPASRRRVS